MSLRLPTRTGDARVRLGSEKDDGSGGEGSPLYIPRNGGQSRGARLGFQGCSPHALKHGAAANNIRGRSLKIELMQQWRSFHSCRMRITVGRDKRAGIIRLWLRTVERGDRMAVRWAVNERLGGATP
ncbi:hypothetical protein PABG_11418 [Paracoccidioides brasiliensis Pb03]|nr:hypothetical protein PABG_11418 [Paracoccidioides brasiliensis Pb03]